MSAQIYIHPRHSGGLMKLCAQYLALGYVLTTNRRGHIQATPIPVLHKVVNIANRRKQ